MKAADDWKNAPAPPRIVAIGFYWGFRDREQPSILDDAAWLTAEAFTVPTLGLRGAGIVPAMRR